MNNLPAKIGNFIAQHQVVNLACCMKDEVWAANCFYVFDQANTRLIILTKSTTKHGQMMLSHPQIAGTITAPAENISQIEGVQFTATARCLTLEKEKCDAQAHYYARYPFAKLIPSEVWELRLNSIKHTENRIAFAQKTYWDANKR